MAIQTVRQLCRISDLVDDDGLVDQIANLDDLHRGIDADAFFRRNHFTEGLSALVRNGFDRLSGRSDGGAFYLSQSMGGGKTHSLIAFALLAQDDGLRHRIIPNIAPTATFGAARVVVFNGHQNPENFLWGLVAERLGRPEAMSRFWKDGAKVPGVDAWEAALGTEPVLILLDELPSYLQMAEGQSVGNSTLADITIGALERLFNALTRLPRACVVVTNLMDDVFAEGSGRLKTLINTLNKQYGKYAHAITPVQQNSGEVFQIIRRKLFDDLPPDDVIDEVAQAYVDELNKAKKIDDIASVPESFIQRIRETYPFHPSIRDIVARFKENPGYQQTRALIRILRLAVRNAWKSDEQIFLIGLQHLDLNHGGTVEEIRKINNHFTNAISKDIADRGNALAEQIDDAAGSTTATSVSKLVLMASLSTAEQPILGLRRSDIVECLVDPLTRTSAISTALDKLSGTAEYLFKGPDERVYFGQTANVISEINNTATSLTEEVVDNELRKKLAEIFEPRSKALYRTLAILPSLDEIKVLEDDVTLIVLERSAKDLPKALTDWWSKLDRQNRVLVLTADLTSLGTLRNVARQIRAIAIVEKMTLARHGKDSSQSKEVEAIRVRAANSFTSSARETFTTLVFPAERGLRDFGQFQMVFDNNDYRGEEQILATLEQRGKFYPSAKVEKEIKALRDEAEIALFDANAVQRSELRRKAAAKPGWYWLASGGLDYLIEESVRTKHWRLRNDLVEKDYQRETSVSARLDGPLDAMLDKGIYKLVVLPEEADIVYASESGPPDPSVSGRVTGRSYETSASRVWFLGVNSKGEAVTGPVYEWLAPILMVARASSTSAGLQVEWTVIPRTAEIRATFDGSDPSRGAVVTQPLSVPHDAFEVRLLPVVDGRTGDVSVIRRAGPSPLPSGPRTIRDDLPLTLLERQKFDSITRLTDALSALKSAHGSAVHGGQVDVGTDEPETFADTTFGDDVALRPEAIETIMATLAAAGGFTATRANASFNSISFSSGKDYKVFADALGLDFERMVWSQDEGR
ncbi:DUF499 domain-containing protein [Methylobacterium sp. J-092]|uniref:DUF499 domain-containing protein n=1 Tax=Methylobacterium sp. J-092 TaxID=2836667 RepID=UPI001FB8CC52|nr:DUF499 domain-containing protein [Methylobacterium sp. J-092]MCJ2007043.1 DUF499 domain-containing protein [Methylobacterium sp. J-092]